MYYYDQKNIIRRADNSSVSESGESNSLVFFSKIIDAIMHCSLYGLSIADPARIDRVMNNRANALDIKVMEEVAYKG